MSEFNMPSDQTKAYAKDVIGDVKKLIQETGIKEQDFTVDQIIEMYHIALDMQRLDLLWDIKEKIDESENRITGQLEFISSAIENLELPETKVIVESKNKKEM